jgi:hypothetical protein
MQEHVYDSLLSVFVVPLRKMADAACAQKLGQPAINRAWLGVYDIYDMMKLRVVCDGLWTRKYIVYCPLNMNKQLAIVALRVSRNV